MPPSSRPRKNKTGTLHGRLLSATRPIVFVGVFVSAGPCAPCRAQVPSFADGGDVAATCSPAQPLAEAICQAEINGVVAGDRLSAAARAVPPALCVPRDDPAAVRRRVAALAASSHDYRRLSYDDALAAGLFRLYRCPGPPAYLPSR